MRKNKKIILWAVAVIFAIALFLYVKNNFSFGFAPLFCFLLLFMLLPLALKERYTQVVKDTRTGRAAIVYQRDKKGRPRTAKWNSVCGALAIFIFGWLALYSLGNYFNPREEVYSNYQHHALRIDGVKVPSDKLPFDLAGANNYSFIDNPGITGEIRIVGFDSTSVRLKTIGLLNPIYLKSDTHSHENLNCELVKFKKGDTVELISTEKDDSGERLKCSFVLNEGHENAGIVFKPSFHFNIHSIDTTQCVFISEGGQKDTSLFNSFLKSGYPLSDIAAGIPTKMDLDGIKIVRDSIDLNVKRRNIRKTYADRGYMLELSPSSRLYAVRVNNGDMITVKQLSSITGEISIPLSQSFYVGIGNHTLNSFKFEVSENTLYVKFAHPKYQYLQASEDSRAVSLMVTSTIIKEEHPKDGESGLVENLTDNILLFDLFDNYDNSFQIKPFYLNYRVGPTNENMSFSVLTQDNKKVEHKILANTSFRSVKSYNGTEWIVSVENFKETTPFRAETLSWILLIIVIVSTLSMLSSTKGRLFTGVEYVFHLIIIAFFAVRFFLLWRITTFPPVSSISLFEYSYFRELRWLSTPLICITLFYIVIAVAKLCLTAVPGNMIKKPFHLWNFIVHSAEKVKDYFGKKNRMLFAGLILLVEIQVAIVGKISGSPVLSVFMPVAVYLCIDLCIYWIYATSYLDDINRSRREDAIGERAYALILSIFNMIVTSLGTICLDGGFGVMFTMFMLFSFWLKLTDIYQYTRYSKGNRILPKISFACLFIALASIVIFYKKIFIYLCRCVKGEENIWLFFIVVWLAIGVITALTLIVLEIKIKIKIKKKNIIWIVPVFVAILVLVTWGAVCLSGKMEGSHMEYRTRVHMESVGEILKSVDSHQAQNKFLQASLNDWILHEYQEIGKEVILFGEKGHGYFKLQPQSKLGAMWFAQTTDICLSRFIIAEHGAGLAWLLVLSFALLLMLSLFSPSASRWSRIISSQVALLLAVQSLMILLANTRAFIFFGQDFPIISLTSRLSSIYFFSLATLAVCSALAGKMEYNDELYDDIEKERVLNRICRSMTFNMMVFFIVSALFLYLSRENLNVSKSDKEDRNESSSSANKETAVSYYRDRTYDADAILVQMSAEIDEYINPVLREYQRTNKYVPELQRDMSGYINEFFNKHPGVDSLCSPHTQLVMRKFIQSWSKSNSVNNIIYLRNKRFTDDKAKRHDSLDIAVRTNYYKFELPGKATQQWAGSVLQYNPAVLKDSVYRIEADGYSCFYIPGQYSASGNPVQILKVSRGKSAQVISSDAIINAGKELDVVKVGSLDFVVRNNRNMIDLPLSRQKYFARRIKVNGNRTFIYPYGQKLFWARDEAFRIKKNKEKSLKNDFKMQGDAYMTIDIDLCCRIYDKIENKDRDSKLKSEKGTGDDRTIVVADGDGNVRALVNHRMDKTFRLNPNDYKMIAKIADSLYLWGERGRPLEERYFADFTSSFLRNGPGSSQKPILWTAVTSMYNTGWWPDLKMAGIGKNDKYLDQSYITDGKRYIFNHFAGKQIESKFRSIKDDEGNGNDVGLQYYVYMSSNYYNAIIAYLGAFPKSVYEEDGFLDNLGNEKDGQSLFKSRPKLSPPQKGTKDPYEYEKKYIKTFPTIYAGSSKPKVFNRFLDAKYALDTNALATYGLSTNFGLKHTGNLGSPSKYNINIRKDKVSDRQLNEYMVRSVAIGSNSIWLVTMRKMAEMYGRLISMNKAYTLHTEYCDDNDAKYEFFNLDNSWGNADADNTKYKEYMTARKNLILGMSKVFSKYGTARKFTTLPGKSVGSYTLRIDDGEKLSKEDEKSLYIYGKTGTIDGRWGGGDNEDHLLATIITDKKVSVCSLEDLKKMKFYVIYQADYNFNAWTDIDEEVITEVLNSATFKKYMCVN